MLERQKWLQEESGDANKHLACVNAIDRMPMLEGSICLNVAVAGNLKKGNVSRSKIVRLRICHRLKRNETEVIVIEFACHQAHRLVPLPLHADHHPAQIHDNYASTKPRTLLLCGFQSRWK